MDETRLGLQTVRQRRITARGIKPVGTYQHAFTNFYLYGAIAPRTGDAYFLGVPTLSAAHFQRFLDDFSQLHPDTRNVLLVDNSRTRTCIASWDSRVHLQRALILCNAPRLSNHMDAFVIHP